MNIQGERFGDAIIGVYRVSRGGPTFHVGSDSELGRCSITRDIGTEATGYE
jgi:hypothetical protein